MKPKATTKKRVITVNGVPILRGRQPEAIESDEPSESDEVEVLKKLLKESTQKLKRCQERLAYATADLNATTDRAVGYLRKIEELES